MLSQQEWRKKCARSGYDIVNAADRSLSLPLDSTTNACIGCALPFRQTTQQSPAFNNNNAPRRSRTCWRRNLQEGGSFSLVITFDILLKALLLLVVCTQLNNGDEDSDEEDSRNLAMGTYIKRPLRWECSFQPTGHTRLLAWPNRSPDRDRGPETTGICMDIITTHCRMSSICPNRRLPIITPRIVIMRPHLLSRPPQSTSYSHETSSSIHHPTAVSAVQTSNPSSRERRYQATSRIIFATKP